MIRPWHPATHLVSGLLLIATLLFAPVNSASAALVIVNSPNTVNGGSTLSNTDHKAILFTTGPYASYVTSLVLGLNPPSGTPFTGALNISLWSATSNGTEYEPGTQLATTGVQSVTINSTQSLYAFDGIFGGGFSMSASTPYALVLSSDADEIKWGRNTTGSITTGGGFTFHSFNLSTDSGGSWTTSSVTQDNAIVMEVAVVPEPGTWAAGAGFLALAVGAHLRRGREKLRADKAAGVSKPAFP
jgi:hypothetical protein